MIDSISSVAASIGLHLNSAKCKVMSCCATDPPVFVNGSPIEYVPAFNYLGSSVACDGQCGAEVMSRISKAWVAFQGLKVSGEVKSTQRSNCVSTMLL